MRGATTGSAHLLVFPAPLGDPPPLHYFRHGPPPKIPYRTWSLRFAYTPPVKSSRSGNTNAAVSTMTGPIIGCAPGRRQLSSSSVAVSLINSSWFDLVPLVLAHPRTVRGFTDNQCPASQ